MGKVVDSCCDVFDDELEAESYFDENAEDEVYVMNGRGEMVKLEVPDDADD